jgi:flagellar motility protein MotE (MotC chaperone)
MSAKFGKFAEIAFFSFSGLCFFAVAFMGFVAAAGVPLNEVAVVGSMFHVSAPEGGAGHGESGGSAVTDAHAGERSGGDAAESAHGGADEGSAADHGAVQVAHSAGLGVLAAFSLEAPYRAEELEELVNALRAERLELDAREAELADREGWMRERQAQVTAQIETLQELRAALDTKQRELELREAEVKGQEDTAANARTAHLGEMARLFESGEPEELAPRLVQFTPEEAGRMLRALSPERAVELLNALPSEQWKAYSESYGRTVPSR